MLDIDWLDPIDDAKVIEHIAEVALIFALFSSGLKLDRPLRWREWGSVTRLLALAMPLTMAGVALFGSQVMGLSLGAALLLGAILCPTDPVLAGDIGVGPPGDEAEHEPNFALTAEAGGNDGLAAPLVLIGIFVAEQGGTAGSASGSWPTSSTPARPGVAIGAAVGLVGGVERPRPARPRAARARRSTATTRSRPRSWSTARPRPPAATASSPSSSAAWPSAATSTTTSSTGAHEGAEQVEKFMELAVILLLGSLLTGGGLTAPGWDGWLLAIVLLVVIRPLSTFVSLVRSQVETAGGRTFVAWFGVRGVGTLYYAATVVAAGVLSGGEEKRVVWTAIACVIVSIVVHGVTGGPALRLLFRNLREEERAAADPPLRPRPAPEPATPPAR